MILRQESDKCWTTWNRWPKDRAGIALLALELLRTHKGSGLGPAVVHGIVKRYNRAITVQRDRGIDSTFSIYIPAM